ncbi:CreA family protein [Salinimonas iocasae]|uniref:CreA family protein n=1 Tax=Salinimonas iocasae TaxID=2572577 RepID=A0A5B7YDH8_9ALTE|nr:CreA family protein [Salinimonas iocasae]QCZ93732.1 CreA family protein [Salinimonas iocasae]
MKKTLSLLTAVLLLGACSDENSVRTGIFSASTVDWEVAKDPDIPGVTCHVQHISANLSISDPSNMSIACRQSDEITLFDLEKAEIEEPKMIFKESKSIFFKSIKVRRTYDEENQVIVYTAFSTKETSGSFKHAISTVPLYGTEAFRDN